VAVTASGQSVYAISSLSIGTHTITAVYSGDTNYSPSTGTLIQIVNQPRLLFFLFPRFGEQGDTVYIYGSNFSGVTAVKFGGTNAAGYYGQLIDLDNRRGREWGYRSVLVTTPGGTASKSGFTFTDEKKMRYRFTTSSLADVRSANHTVLHCRPVAAAEATPGRSIQEHCRLG
jgi:hypothetical protein